MPKELTDEQLLKILEKLPEDLKTAFFSTDTAEYIANVCEKFDVPGKKVTLIAGAVGDILLKTAPPEEFSKILEKEVGLKKEQAENIARELDFRIFSQVRESLTGALPRTEQRKETSAPSAEQPAQKGPDVYREAV
ncbi:MAG: hypothetical protein HYV47_02165 [Candidatus Nealsonbacteria bacterium]|nr:hypothetical protein [Candidatus Nealsonbacteria bacterium]